MKRYLSLFLAAIMISTALYPLSASAESIYQNNDIEHIVIHDPSIVKSEDGKYYCVGSHLVMGKSDDLVNWQNLGYTMGDGETPENTYLAPAGSSWKDTLVEPLEWCMRYQKAAVNENGEHIYNDSNYEYNCWANDIIYNPVMKKYCLYGCCSVWGTTASAIWLCTSDNIEGPYEYVDTLIESGITSKARDESGNPVLEAMDYHNSNIMPLVNDLTYSSIILNKRNAKGVNWLTYDGYYNLWAGGFPNCIDPTVFSDKNGDMWLVYGSFSGGCFMHKLSLETGLVDHAYMKQNKSAENDDVYYGKQISRTNGETEGTGEGPYIVYDRVSDYYYFFLTYGGLAGDGGYNIREYRSKSPMGPYLDKAGNSALDMKNTGLKLDGNYKFSCNASAYLSGGHSSCLVDSDGSIYQAYHTRFTADDGCGFQTRIHKMLRTSDGWAVMLPFEYQGEKDTASVTKSEAAGVYEFIDSNNMTQRKEKAESPWSDIVLPTQRITLNANGTISGAKDYSCSITKANTGSKAVSGSWTLANNSAYCTIKLGTVTYNCVFAYQSDESKEAKRVLTFTGAGSDNSTVWGVKSASLPPVTPAKPATTVKKINVAVPSSIKLVKAKKAITVRWKKKSGISGYQIKYTLKKNMKSSKTVTAKGSASSKKLKKLKAKKKYYVQIRAYKKVGNKTYYSSWSPKKSIKTK